MASPYDVEAPAYAELWAPVLLPHSLRLLRGRLPDQPRRVLDLACGVGTLLPAQRERWPGVPIVAADYTPAMLALAPPAFPRVVADAVALPFPAGSFDVALMAFALQHMPDPGLVVREMARVVGPGGTVGLATWGDEPEVEGDRVVTEELDRAGAAPEEARSPGLEVTNSPEKVASLLAAAGFGGVQQEWEPLDFTPTAAESLELATRMGRTARRFRSLEPAAQDACRAALRTRLAALPRDALADRSVVVRSWARQGAGG